MGILDFIRSNIEMIYLVILMIFVGIELISHVPSVLHTPLMSGANAIHGVVIIGAIIVVLFGTEILDWYQQLLSVG